MTIKEMLGFTSNKGYWFSEEWNSERKWFWLNKHIRWYDQWKDGVLHGFDKNWDSCGEVEYHAIYEYGKISERLK